MARALVPNLDALAEAGETATETLIRLAQTTQQTEDALRGISRGLPQALGITGLEQYRSSLAVAEFQAPRARVRSAQEQLARVYNAAMAGDLAAVGAFPQLAQQMLGISRDVFASGPEFAEMFKGVNTLLNNLLTHQRELQDDILKDVPISIREASIDQIAEIRKQTAALVDQFERLRAEIRSAA
jgi:ubiquinone biosynthesis protein UbiJ